MSPAPTGDLAQRIESLADRLAAVGDLTRDEWRQAMHAVPRHQFVPSTAWVLPEGPHHGYPIDLAADPGRWWDAVYSDTAIITQIDDGATDPATGAGMFTSSCSAPGVVVDFLERLYPDDHSRVLEIGTGTGWTAGLLSHRVGAENVVSVEIDENLTARAADNLKTAGYTPELVVADGVKGHPDRAPYDRVHVTCGVTSIPRAWIEQTRPGGFIILPWMPLWGDGGHKLRLQVLADRTAVGRFVGGCGYMMMRSQRFGSLEEEIDDTTADSTTLVDPRQIATDNLGAHLALAAMLPDVLSTTTTGEDGEEEFTLTLHEATGHAWARATYRPGRADFDVRSGGGRRLWDETVDAYMQWASWGRPNYDRFGMTITDYDTTPTIWLDTPSNPVSTYPPRSPGVHSGP